MKLDLILLFNSFELNPLPLEVSIYSFHRS